MIVVNKANNGYDIIDISLCSWS